MRESWRPLGYVIGAAGLLGAVLIVGSMISVGTAISDSLAKGPAMDARWIQAPLHSAARSGKDTVVHIQLIAGTRAPQFGVDSFMVFVGNAEPSNAQVLQRADTLAALLRTVENWTQPIDLEIVSKSLVTERKQIGTLRIDDLQVLLSVFEADLGDRKNRE
jgi:hypothetical protein